VVPGSPRRVEWWPPAIAAVAVAAYLPALRAGLVFDDHVLVEGNRFLRGPLWKIWFTTATSDYWPVTWSALWLEWRLWGDRALGYHVTNVALHAAAAVLLWVILRRLRVPGAGLAGLLFAVHPVAVESVAWISEQKNTLSAVLLECSVLSWLGADDDRQARRYGLALLLFALALLAKGSVVMAPVVLVGLELARRRRLDRTTLLRLAPFFGLSLAAGLANVWFQSHNAMAGGWAPDRSLGVRLAGAAWALLSYVQKAYLPVHLAIIYPDWPVSPDSPLFYVPAAGVLLVAGFLAWAVHRWSWARPCSWALGYQAVQLLPVLGLVDMAFSAIAPVSNHLQYLALMGPVALMGTGADAVARRSPTTARAVGAVVVLAFGATTFHRAGAFSDDHTLWTSAVREAPRSVYARLQLAGELVEEGDVPGAAAELGEAAAYARDPADRHRLRAQAALYAGRPVDAVGEAREALRLGGNPEVRRDAAVILVQTGNASEAIPVLQALVRAAPGASDYTYWLAAALSRAGRIGEGLEVLRTWCRERPGHPRMERTLAVLLVRLGRPDEARERAAIEAGVAPSDPRSAARLEEWLRAQRGR